MSLTLTELLREAKALPRQERAELTEALLHTLGTADVSDEARLTALRSAVDAGIASLDAGEGIHIPEGGLRDYLRERGRLATARAATKQP
jgi:hypothetical protein